MLNRRNFIKSTAGVAAAPLVVTACGGGSSSSDTEVTVFSHGIASGDPVNDAVIIWTRITPEDETTSSKFVVQWQVSEDPDMRNSMKSGSVTTSKAQDFTVKVDVTGLNSGKNYYYQFTGPDGKQKTEIGKTLTLPQGEVSEITLGVCSCANYAFGFFNAYEYLGQSDADIILHLGDYIYEYQAGVYPSSTVGGRNPEPANEIISLTDYRQRYAQYRTDVQLQSAHKSKPFICVWDDHELANDAYKDGAQNHNEGEGDFNDRKRLAFQAYHEWMPIRTGSDQSKIYRRFDIGNLLTLNMLDTRHLGRDKPIDLVGDFPEVLQGDISGYIAEVASPERSLLGSEQNEWLHASLIDSNARWQVLGQQVLMGRMNFPVEVLLSVARLRNAIRNGQTGDEVAALQDHIKSTLADLHSIKAGNKPGTSDPAGAVDLARLAALPYNLDAWDGYHYEREALLSRAAQLNKNLVVLAGDTHNAWANELRLMGDDFNVSDQRVGVELATSAVTSPGFDAYLTFDEQSPAEDLQNDLIALIDDLRFFDATRRGFLTVKFTPQEMTANWHFLNKVTVKNGVNLEVESFTVKADGVVTVDKLIRSN